MDYLWNQLNDLRRRGEEELHALLPSRLAKADLREELITFISHTLMFDETIKSYSYQWEILRKAVRALAREIEQFHLLHHVDSKVVYMQGWHLSTNDLWKLREDISTLDDSSGSHVMCATILNIKNIIQPIPQEVACDQLRDILDQHWDNPTERCTYRSIITGWFKVIMSARYVYDYIHSLAATLLLFMTMLLRVLCA